MVEDRRGSVAPVRWERRVAESPRRGGPRPDQERPALPQIPPPPLVVRHDPPHRLPILRASYPRVSIVSIAARAAHIPPKSDSGGGVCRSTAWHTDAPQRVGG